MFVAAAIAVSIVAAAAAPERVEAGQVAPAAGTEEERG
jgi:hypothetical protein